MKASSFPASAWVLAACLFILAGCATPPKKPVDSNSKKDGFIDAGSGVWLPKEVASLVRTSLEKDDPTKNPITAHYSPVSDSLYLEASVRLIPAYEINPDQLLAETIHSVDGRPNFEQSDYTGMKNFGALNAVCTQCSFDNLEFANRTIFKIVIIPRGNYLLCFTFMVRPAQEHEAQSVIDSFIQEILADSDKKKVLMTPSKAPGGDDSDAEDLN